MSTKVFNEKEITETGERIYRERYKDEFERNHYGKFVAIDVETGQAFLGDTLNEVGLTAIKEAPGSWFHFIRVGYAGVVHMGHRGYVDRRS